MSAGLPVTVTGADCCQTSCSDSTSTQVPGPAGADGAPGAAGSDGINSFTTLSANFTMPASLATASATVVSSAWASIGQIVYMQNAGWLRVTAKADAIHLTLQNLETATAYTENVAPTTVIAAPATISPGGLQGPAGTASSATLNSISPTTTKGDLIVDNGANSPAANDVRQAVGTNGQLLAADSTAGTGIAWKSVVPNAATDNAVVRFDGAAGTPIPLQTSKLIVTDNGAVQASGSGGNARGTDAVDLQVNRTLATQVASGNKSVICGGQNNTASSTDDFVGGGSGNSAAGGNSAVAGGAGNTANGSQSFIGGGAGNQTSSNFTGVACGTSNTSSSTNAFVGGGSSNIASGTNSTVSGGASNTASAENSAVLGGANALADKFGQAAFSAGQFASQGDAQKSELIWRTSTTDATANVEMFLDGSGTRAVVPNNTTWAFDIILVIRRSTGTDAVLSAKGGIHNNGGTVAMTAAATIAVIADGSGGTFGVAGTLAVTADAANVSLKLAVTGVVGNNLRYVAHGRMVEVGY